MGFSIYRMLQRNTFAAWTKSEKNVEEEKRNLSYFFQKWPEYEVEIISWLNDFEGCKWFDQHRTLETDYAISISEIRLKEDLRILLIGFPEHLHHSIGFETKHYLKLFWSKLLRKQNAFQKMFRIACRNMRRPLMAKD